MYVFLDIDGVLNTRKDWGKPFTINPACVKEFCNVFAGSRVVLTSSWKNGFVGYHNPANLDCIKEIERIFDQHDIKIIGKVDNIENREAAVRAYVNTHKIDQYLIIDDDKSLFPTQKTNICFTDERKGFSRKDYKKCT